MHLAKLEESLRNQLIALFLNQTELIQLDLKLRSH